MAIGESHRGLIHDSPTTGPYSNVCAECGMHDRVPASDRLHFFPDNKTSVRNS